MTGIRFGGMGNILGMMVSLFPVIDPIMVIVMIARRVEADFAKYVDML